jgi:hypothetical protein
MELLNKRFGLRNLLSNQAYHNFQGSIPKSELTIEKEPDFHKTVSRLASELVANPNVLLVDEYSQEERKKDWINLVKQKTVKLDSRSRVGHKLLDHHMPHFWRVKNPKGKSVTSMMTLHDLQKAILLNVQMHSTPYVSEIRRTLVLSGGLASVTKYRAGMAKFIVSRYSAKRVLDPCIGWGGRMIGSLAADAEYIGCDPDLNTFQGLQGILQDIDKSAQLYNSPAESILPTLETGSVDMILTSPPYYNLELYTSGDQSVKENMSWESWVSNWLRPLVLQCLRVLKPDGTSCWSVKNFKHPLADVVRDIHTEKGFVCVESITLQGPGRPGVTKPSEEQTFIYRKTGV